MKRKSESSTVTLSFTRAFHLMLRSGEQCHPEGWTSGTYFVKDKQLYWYEGSDRAVTECESLPNNLMFLNWEVYKGVDVLELQKSLKRLITTAPWKAGEDLWLHLSNLINLDRKTVKEIVVTWHSDYRFKGNYIANMSSVIFPNFKVTRDESIIIATHILEFFNMVDNSDAV